MTFDGIWAMASLLHVPEEDMRGIVSKYRDRLNPDGIFFMSFKKYKENFTLGERSFTCYEEEGLRAMITEVGGLEILKLIETTSAKADNTDERWVSAFCRKST